MISLIIYIIQIPQESWAGLSSRFKMAQERPDIFYCTQGGANGRIPGCGLALAWFDSLIGSKVGSTQAFLSACTDAGIMGRERGEA